MGLKLLKKSTNLELHTIFSLNGVFEDFQVRLLLDSTTSSWKRYQQHLACILADEMAMPTANPQTYPNFFALNLQKQRKGKKSKVWKDMEQRKAKNFPFKLVFFCLDLSYCKLI